MPCSCNLSHCPECCTGIEDWSPPEEGEPLWLDSQASSYCIDKGYFSQRKSMIVKLPEVKGYKLGFMAIRYMSSGGYDYFRVDSIENQDV